MLTVEVLGKAAPFGVQSLGALLKTAVPSVLPLTLIPLLSAEAASFGSRAAKSGWAEYTGVSPPVGAVGCALARWKDRTIDGFSLPRSMVLRELRWLVQPP